MPRLTSEGPDLITQSTPRLVPKAFFEMTQEEQLECLKTLRGNRSMSAPSKRPRKEPNMLVSDGLNDGQQTRKLTATDKPKPKTILNLSLLKGKKLEE